MKNSSDILNHIISKPCFYKLKESFCINKLKSALPKRISNSIKFAYVKNDTLFIAVSHSGAKMELNNDYNISLIKRVLKLIKMEDNECEKYTKEKIKIFVSITSSEKAEVNSHESSSKKEKSKGFFINQAKNQEIKEIFEKIRKIIK